MSSVVRCKSVLQAGFGRHHFVVWCVRQTVFVLASSVSGSGWCGTPTTVRHILGTCSACSFGVGASVSVS
jgi:hypothetical protein